MNEGIRKHIFILALATNLLLGCVGITEVDPSDSTRQGISLGGGDNTALIYPSNPTVLKGKNVARANFKGHLNSEFITSNAFLETTCSFEQHSPDFFNPGVTIPFTDTTDDECLVVLNDTSTDTTVLQSENSSWDFSLDSDEFYQVNTFYHVNLMFTRFHEALSFTHKYVHLDGNLTIAPATKYNFADTQSYFLTDSGVISTLKAYSKCALSPINAFFSPAEDIICFGYDESFSSTFRIVQDPSIIYHEVGHALVKIMMNQRNVTSGVNPATSLPIFEAHPYESDLGSLFYDEAGAINEGIADYFAHVITGRTAVGEFAIQQITGLARPITEDDKNHTIPVSSNLGERLAYPDYLQYNPVDPTEVVEDVHYAGQIVTHYLTALTSEFKNSCQFDSTDSDAIHEYATNYVVLLLNETLAEIGDLTAKGSDLFSQYATLDTNQENVYFTNLNPDESFLWSTVVNPPNFRRFFRTFGKNIFHHVSNGLCPEFTLDDSEQLLDEYGLLLFKSYEDRGNGLDSDNFNALNYALYTGYSVFNNKLFMPFVFNTQVNEDNRKKSILISKDFIEISSTDSIAFVIDSQGPIKKILSNLTFEGENVTTTEGIAGPEFNNGNVKFSPGEVVAVSLNLFNNSNSTMGGVQFLANDWDHMKLGDTSATYINRTSNRNGLANGDITGAIGYHSPCIIDEFPTASEGGVTDTSTTTQGNCSYISKTNASIDTSEIVSSTVYPKYELDSPQPICLVQYSDDSETRWVSQDFFRQYELGLEDSDCLNNPSMSGDNFNGNECLMRALPGAAQAVLGKINAQNTWSSSITDVNGEFVFDSGHLVLMEINKWIQPGTKFNCRFRVRFTNCSDCFDEFEFGDSAASLTDYPDFEYAGDKGFKVINLQFTVLD